MIMHSAPTAVSHHAMDGFGSQLYAAFSCMLYARLSDGSVAYFAPFDVQRRQNFGARTHGPCRGCKRVYEAVHHGWPREESPNAATARSDCYESVRARCERTGTSRCSKAQAALAREWQLAIQAMVPEYNATTPLDGYAIHIREGDRTSRITWLHNLLRPSRQRNSISHSSVDYSALHRELARAWPLSHSWRAHLFVEHRGEGGWAAKQLAPSHVSVHVGGEPLQSWLAMLRSRVLIPDDSMFSASAALISSDAWVVAHRTPRFAPGSYWDLGFARFPCGPLGNSSWWWSPGAAASVATGAAAATAATAATVSASSSRGEATSDRTSSSECGRSLHEHMMIMQLRLRDGRHPRLHRGQPLSMHAHDSLSTDANSRRRNSRRLSSSEHSHEGASPTATATAIATASSTSSASASAAPLLLYSLPGSGNTFVRLLLESHGIRTGSVYTDHSLLGVLPGERGCDGIVKAHPFDYPAKTLLLGGRSPGSSSSSSSSQSGFQNSSQSSSQSGSSCARGAAASGLIPSTDRGWPAKCAKHACGGFGGAVVILRDPIEAMLSEFQRQQSHGHASAASAADLDEFPRWAATYSRRVRSVYAHDYSYIRRYVPRHLFVQYERLRDRNVSELIRLLSFVTRRPPSEFDPRRVGSANASSASPHPSSSSSTSEGIFACPLCERIHRRQGGSNLTLLLAEAERQSALALYGSARPPGEWTAADEWREGYGGSPCCGLIDPARYRSDFWSSADAATHPFSLVGGVDEAETKRLDGGAISELEILASHMRVRAAHWWHAAVSPFVGGSQGGGGSIILLHITSAAALVGSAAILLGVAAHAWRKSRRHERQGDGEVCHPDSPAHFRHRAAAVALALLLALISTRTAPSKGGATAQAGAGDSSLQQVHLKDAADAVGASAPTFLFIAGLGGTGHHYWMTALQVCPFCHDAPELRKHLHAWWYDGRGDINSTARLLREHANRRPPPTPHGSTVVAHGANHTGGAHEEHRQPPPIVWCLNAASEEGGTGMLSYPNAADRHHRPHVDWLAEAARIAGVRLKVLLLTRDGRSLVESVGRRFGASFARHWGGVDRQHPVAAAMAAMAEALREQALEARRVDPSLLECAAFEGMPDAAANLDRLLLLSPPSETLHAAPQWTTSTSTPRDAPSAWTFAQHARKHWHRPSSSSSSSSSTSSPMPSSSSSTATGHHQRLLSSHGTFGIDAGNVPPPIAPALMRVKEASAELASQLCT